MHDFVGLDRQTHFARSRLIQCLSLAFDVLRDNLAPASTTWLRNWRKIILRPGCFPGPTGGRVAGNDLVEQIEGLSCTAEAHEGCSNGTAHSDEYLIEVLGFMNHASIAPQKVSDARSKLFLGGIAFGRGSGVDPHLLGRSLCHVRIVQHLTEQFFPALSLPSILLINWVMLPPHFEQFPQRANLLGHLRRLGVVHVLEIQLDGQPVSRR